MAKPRQTKSKPAPKATDKLVAALQFLKLGQKDTGIADYQTHVNMFNGYAVTFDGIIAAGIKLDEEINAVCETNRLIAALKQCGEAYSITHTEGGKLSIKSGKFRALVPTLDPAAMPTIEPDAPVAVIDDRLKTALEALNWIVEEQGDRVHLASFLLQSGSLLATNGRVAAEYWHGIDLPPGLVIPKPFAAAIIRAGKTLAKFGFSPRTITVWFEDESFIRTQLFEDQWPDIYRILNVPSQPVEVPKGFFDAIRVVKPFSVDGLVYCNKGEIASHPFEGEGATFELAGVPEGPAYIIDNVLGIEPLCETIDFSGATHMFFGNNVRGAIVGERPYMTKIKPAGKLSGPPPKMRYWHHPESGSVFASPENQGPEVDEVDFATFEVLHKQYNNGEEYIPF